MLRACARRGDGTRTEAWISRMQTAGEFPNTLCHNAALAAHARARDAGTALAKVQDMEKSAFFGSQPDAASYASAASACAGAGMLEEAEALVLRAESCGLVPNARTYSGLIQRAARLGDVTRAGRLLSRMDEAELHPSAFALRDVLRACSPPMAGLALRVLRQLEALAPGDAQILQEARWLAGRPLAEMGSAQPALELGAAAKVSTALRLTAAAHAVPYSRPRALEAAAAALAAGGAAALEGGAGRLLRRALGGRCVEARRPGARAHDPLPKRCFGPLGATVAASRLAAALDLGDARRAEGWLRRRLVLHELDGWNAPLRLRRGRLPRSERPGAGRRSTMDRSTPVEEMACGVHSPAGV